MKISKMPNGITNFCNAQQRTLYYVCDVIVICSFMYVNKDL